MVVVPLMHIAAVWGYLRRHTVDVSTGDRFGGVNAKNANHLDDD